MRAAPSFRLAILGLCILALAACAPAASPTLSPSPSLSAPPVHLTPYQTKTPTQSPPPPDPSTPTPFPTPTPTPLVHAVRQGEDLFGISLRYGITLPDLIAANPEVNPNFMSIGTQLIIPYSTLPTQAGGILPTPTPIAAALLPANCALSADGGLWCLVGVHNPLESALESVTGVVRLADANGVQVAERIALLPLNKLPAGATLPLMAFFPPPVPEAFQVNASLLTALPVTEDQRYLPVELEDVQVEVRADGLSALVQGTARLDGDLSARTLWLALVAYAANGEISGVRRWESSDGVTAGGSLAFQVVVYSLGQPITHVETFAEARP